MVDYTNSFLVPFKKVLIFTVSCQSDLVLNILLANSFSLSLVDLTLFDKLLIGLAFLLPSLTIPGLALSAAPYELRISSTVSVQVLDLEICSLLFPRILSFVIVAEIFPRRRLRSP